MRSKFMFKDKCSDDFHIIVNSLPPITKPPKKIEVIEIDGLNGDLTVDNGYAAYDKARQEYWSGLPLPSPWLFSSCGYWKPLCSCSVQASHCDGFSCCRAWALEWAGFSSCGAWA